MAERSIPSFEDYMQHGWVLVPIEQGKKGPRHALWNERENCYPPQKWNWPEGTGMGLAHAYSNTCAIDADQYDAACQALEWGYGVDLDHYFRRPERVEIYSGRHGHGKLIFARPPGLILPSASIRINGRHVIEFRCATRGGLTVQDVLPPTIHPNTGRPYEFRGREDWWNPEEIPTELWTIWEQLANPKRERPIGDSPPIQVNHSEIERALSWLSPDLPMSSKPGEADWIKVGMALHSTGDDSLIDLWDEWSQGSREGKYKGRGDIEARWRSFSDPSRVAGDAVTLRSLFLWEREAQRECGYAESRFNPVNTGTASVQMSVEELKTQIEGFSRDTDSGAVYEAMTKISGLEPLWQGELLELIHQKTKRLKGDLREQMEQIVRQQRQQPGTGVAGPTFPLLHRDHEYPLPHITNLVALCEFYGITVRYNEMTHEPEVTIPFHQWTVANWKNEQLSFMKDLFVKHYIPYERCKELMDAHASANSYHPFRDLLESADWDGVSRWPRVLNAFKTEHPEKRDLYLRRWLISAVAAVKGWDIPGRTPPRGVLILQGKQKIGKTTSLKYLTPAGMFGEGITLDTSSPDSRKQSVGHLINELGELEGTFRRSDIARLKQHISRDRDILRRPYAESESTYPRQCIYAGTLNQEEFLVDQTGNTRFWPIECIKIDLNDLEALHRSPELLQFWKEVESWYDAGETWLLSDEETRELEVHNEQFREKTTAEELLRDLYQWDVWPEVKATYSLTEITDNLQAHSRRGFQKGEVKTAIKKLTEQEKARDTSRNGVSIRGWDLPPRCGQTEGHFTQVGGSEVLYTGKPTLLS